MQQKKTMVFFTVSPRLLFMIPFFCILLAVQPAYGAQMLIPSGKTVGVAMDTKGLLVLGTGGVDGKDNHTHMPCKGILQAGDLLLQAEGKELENKEMLMEMVENSGGREVSLLLRRNGEEKRVSVKPVFSVADHSYKLGAWVRDSIQGIGTVTYYDPADGSFGALGHGVYDVDTEALMEMRTGKIVPADLTAIVKGEKGKAGELVGNISMQEELGHIRENTEAGIFGSMETGLSDEKAIPTTDTVRTGEAYILSDLAGDGVEAYEIQIESVQKHKSRNHKDMTLRVTDEKLLSLTGGIVQGISGSPILQDGKLAGAVTHVLVNDPTRGYGIFIENMLEAE